MGERLESLFWVVVCAHGYATKSMAAPHCPFPTNGYSAPSQNRTGPVKASGSQLSAVSTILTYYVRVPFVSGIRGREWHSWVAPSEAHSTSEEAGGGTVRSTGGRSTGGWHRPKHRWHRPKHTLVVAKAKLGLEPRCRNRFGALTLDGNRMQTRSRASSPTTAIGLAG